MPPVTVVFVNDSGPALAVRPAAKPLERPAREPVAEGAPVAEPAEFELVPARRARTSPSTRRGRPSRAAQRARPRAARRRTTARRAS